MNTAPTVPKPSLSAVDPLTMPVEESSSWLARMATLAARYNDAQIRLTKLDELLASGTYTQNEMRRYEEDAVRCYGWFVTALVNSYIEEGSNA